MLKGNQGKWASFNEEERANTGLKLKSGGDAVMMCAQLVLKSWQGQKTALGEILFEMATV